MSNQLPRKALISISSFNGAIYPGGHKTGLFFTEALHPFEVLTSAGFEVDLASETGQFGLDEVSLTDPFLSGSDKAILRNASHPFNVKLNSQLKKASELKKEHYGLFFASAGHSALYDYPSAKGLQAIVGDIWERAAWWAQCVMAPLSFRASWTQKPAGRLSRARQSPVSPLRGNSFSEFSIN